MEGGRRGWKVIEGEDPRNFSPDMEPDPGLRKYRIGASEKTGSGSGSDLHFISINLRKFENFVKFSCNIFD